MSDTDKSWYLGPLGDLRPLVCPDTGVSITEERYGGVHQGLSGARTLDITGHRARYEMTLKNLDPSEFAWLEALYTGMIPGPYRLINPMKRNRLSQQATALRRHGGALGLEMPGGTFLGTSADWPSAVPFPGRSVRAAGVVDTLYQLDPGRPVTVFGPGEEITASVYLKANAATTIKLVTDFRGPDEAAEGWVLPVSVTTSWARHTISLPVPEGFDSAVFQLQTTGSTTFNIAAPQLEAGGTATPWEIGGGSPEVIFDQMPTTSPRYPLRTASVTLLET